MARAAFVHALGLVALFLVAAPAAEAQQLPGEAVTVVDPLDIPPEHDPLAHAWDLPGQRGGFYLRGAISLGVHNVRFGPASWEDETGENANGFGTNYQLDLGGFVRPWIALHLDTNLGVLWSADLESDLAIAGAAGRSPDVRVLAYGFAPAVTFFTPSGFYFKPAFGVGLSTVTQSDKSRTSDPGFYMHLVAGKDVYSDRHFSVGLQFDITYMRLGDDDPRYEQRIRQFLFGVSFGFDSL